jgi:hypothetical protein
MITLYLNAVMEMVKMDGSQNELPNMDTALNYLPQPRLESLLSMNGADIYRLWDARNLFLDVKKFFERSHNQTSHQISVFELTALQIYDRPPI